MTSRKYKAILDCSKESPNIFSYIAIYLWLGWLFTIPAILVFLVFSSFFYKNLFIYSSLWIVPISLTSFFYSIEPEFQPFWAEHFSNWIIDHAKKYFSIKIILEESKEDIDKMGPCIFSLEPHDVLPVSIFWCHKSLNIFPNHSIFGCMTSILFKIPFIRHVYSWLSATSIDKSNLIRLISKKKSLVIIPGGVQEVTYLGNRKERVLFLRKRLGFTKFALQQGTSIVPIYSFGQEKTYNFFMSENDMLIKLGRKIGFFPMFFVGMFGLPLGPPKPAPLVVIIGKPIVLPKIDNPSNEEIEKYHSQFIEAYEKLYNDHKEDYGCKDISLKII